MKAPTIFEFIKTEESSFDTEEINVFDNWAWNLKRHVQMSLSLKHGIFFSGENNWLRPFKKVIGPILNLSYTAEDIEVKDITLYVEGENGRALSFLVKKYHDDVYIKENNLDMFIDDMSEEEIDLGGVIVQKGKECPEVLPLQYIAFCDQTDILGGPIGFKYYFSPDKLRQMESRGWGQKSNGANVSIDELIQMAEPEKDPMGTTGQKKNRTTGKQIEVYIVYGSMPEAYLKDNDNMDDYPYQLQIVAFYRDKKNNKIGVTLYRKEASPEDLKFFTSKQIRGRALGEGGAEALFNEQIWTNFLEIHKMKMLEAASKVPLFTDDETYTSKNTITDMENLEITKVAPGTTIQQVPTAAPANVQMFENAINSYWQSAQLVGSAPATLFGEQEYAGQTFKGQERLAIEGKGPHERKKGKRAKFIEEIYRDWIIPDIARKITKGHKFLTTLTADELQYVADCIIRNQWESYKKEKILNGELVMPEEEQIIKDKVREEFSAGGNKRMIEILKDEFKDIEIKININVAGKQKNLLNLTDKILSIFQFVFTNPQGFQQVMQVPGMQKAFSDIMEYSGLNPVDFAGLYTAKLPDPNQQPMQPQQMPMPQMMQPQPQNV